MDPSTSGPVSMGTTIVAIAYDKGVILGADSRTSTGSYIANRVTDKITPLSDKVYILRSGSAADTQAIASMVQYMIAQHQAEADEPITVSLAAKMVQQIAYQNKDNLQAGMIVAGWDKYNGPQVWGIPLGGSFIQSSFATGGSGSAYIYGFCDKYFKPSMTREEAHAFIKKALAYAMGRDGSSGGCIRTVIIDEAGVTRDFIPGSSIPPVYGEMGAIA